MGLVAIEAPMWLLHYRRGFYCAVIIDKLYYVANLSL